MQISNEPIYNTDELIKILTKERARSVLQSSEKQNTINKKIHKQSTINKEVYIKDLDSNEYKRIVCIRIDDDGDLIIETQQE